MILTESGSGVMYTTPTVAKELEVALRAFGKEVVEDDVAATI